MTVKISIDGEGLSFKKAGQIIAFLGADESSSSIERGPLLASSAKILPQIDQSPKELIIQANAKTNAQKITVLGSYLLDKDGNDHFLIKEVQLQLRKLGEEPGNFNRDLKAAMSLKYIYQLPPKKDGKYGITDAGREAIRSQFSEEIKVKPKSYKKHGGFKQSIPPRDEVTELAIVSDLAGYPNFHKLPTKADSILWVMAYCDAQKIESLTPKEVEFLTDKLRSKIPQNAFSPHNKRNIKEGYVSQTDGKFKLQQKGFDHLKAILLPESDEKTE